MIDVSEIILKRKYYFSLPVPRLYRHLINREIPEISNVSRDYINDLYNLYDQANNANYDFAYHEQITLKSITLMKLSQCRKNEPKMRLPCGRRILFLHPRIVWKFYNKNVIARIYEPHQFGDLNFYFKYLFFESTNEFLRYEQEKRKTDLAANKFLLNLADEHFYDLWLFNRIMREADLRKKKRLVGQLRTF